MLSDETLDRLRIAIQAALGPEVAVSAGRAIKGDGAKLGFTFKGDPGPRFGSKRWRNGIGDVLSRLSPWVQTRVMGSGPWAHINLPREAVSEILKKSEKTG